eukprot:UN08328
MWNKMNQYLLNHYYPQLSYIIMKNVNHQFRYQMLIQVMLLQRYFQHMYQMYHDVTQLSYQQVMVSHVQ